MFSVCVSGDLGGGATWLTCSCTVAYDCAVAAWDSCLWGSLLRESQRGRDFMGGVEYIRDMQRANEAVFCEGWAPSFGQNVRASDGEA